MRYALLVAMREYAENAKTKGFWIGILLLPLLLVLSIKVQQWLSTPTRHFILLDQSGDFGKAADAGLDQLHVRDVLKALGKYIAANLKEEHKPKPDPKVKRPKGGAANPDALLETVLASMPEPARELLVSKVEMLVEMTLKQFASKLEDDRPEFKVPERRFVRIPLPDGIAADAPLEEVAEKLKAYMRGDKTLKHDGQKIDLFAAVLIPANLDAQLIRPGGKPQPGGRSGIEYWSANLADSELRDELTRIVDREIQRREYTAKGTDAGVVARVQATRAPWSSLDPKKEAGEEEVSLADIINQWAPVGFVYLLWVSIFTVSNMLLNNTIEEKSNRIIEVLLSSVTAGELMLGKLLGIAGIGLTMVGTWIVSMLLVLGWQTGPEAELARTLFDVLTGSGLLPAFIGYFLLGYVMYASIFLAIGSLCNTLKEAQNMMGPMTLVMMIPLFTMAYIPKDPHGALARLMSWIPIYTPFVMMNRAAADPPMVDVVGTGVLLVLSTMVVVWLSGKVFRRGILRTGQPPRILELLRWMRGAS